ncbi:RNA-protein complex protein Nop10 [Candidatus Woesearchaeota archaeon]|nr:RNA-protein complex protein Nop10 [Candidatus Woesearchaeota archaeon]
MKHMLKCTNCGRYSLKALCSCGGANAIPKPAKFSPEDAYGKYRRQAKQSVLKERGLL